MDPIPLIDELHHEQPYEEAVELLQVFHLFGKEKQSESKWICQEQAQSVLGRVEVGEVRSA